MFGLILIVIAQLSFAIGGLIIRKYLNSYDPLLVSSFMAAISGLIFLPVLFFGFKGTLVNFNPKSIIPFVIAAIFWSVIAEFFYIYGFQKASSMSLASLMTLFFPLFSSILSFFFFKEAFTLKTIIAGILMLTGFTLLAI